MTETTTQRLTLSDAPAIGQYWEGQGGIYAGIVPDYVGTQPRFLIFAADEAVDVQWGGFGGTESGALDPRDGKANTKHLAECSLDSHDHEAAKFASQYEKDGHKDFYLPSRRELDVGYQTIRDRFDAGEWYWSSTEHSSLTAYVRNFGEIELAKLLKALKARARPVRTMPVAGGEAAA
ncbi:DUF1566 domain-containing protein [Trinickia dinghuensis]|uniref:DUF1566 domain-containing protein n=1 Tax=Trinickia dinghuensis TaxID=2291023 RepID=A0A3D8JQR2_9BURK|nr:DUF1566 domain-containing protein [Trinickia dinghuensis]RDU95463.1 DUF1566 domain-containing protein [Trinickia dinghuensis]